MMQTLREPLTISCDFKNIRKRALNSDRQHSQAYNTINHNMENTMNQFSHTGRSSVKENSNLRVQDVS